jgi:hypothetical protein
MGRCKHELEQRGLPERIEKLKAKGDLMQLQKLLSVFDALRDAARNCDIERVNDLTKLLDAITGSPRKFTQQTNTGSQR